MFAPLDPVAALQAFTAVTLHALASGRTLGHAHVHGLDLAFFLDQFFNIGQQAGVVAATHKADRQARGPSAAGAADAVHIVFRIEGQIEIEHGGHIFDIQAARGHISTHQQIDFAFFEGVQRFQALVLAFVAVQRGGVEAFALERARQAGTTQFAVHKHKGLLHATGAQHLVQRGALVFVAHAVETLLDIRCRGVGAGDFNRHRVLQVAAGQALDLRRESGGEQQRGALLGQVAQDALQVGQKADIEHAVGLIEHHVFHLVEHRALGFDMVQQTSGRCHQNLDAFFEFGSLGLHVNATEDHGAAQVGVLGIQLDLLRHLIGQLARGQQHQGAHRVARGRGRGVFVLEHALQQRQGERCRLAGAGLGRAHHVLAGQHHGNGLGLDRRHALVAHFGHGAGQFVGELELGKSHRGRSVVRRRWWGGGSVRRDVRVGRFGGIQVRQIGHA